MKLFALTAAACLIALTIPAYRLFDAERANVGAVPKTIERVAGEQGDQTRKFVGTWLTQNLMPPVNRMVNTVDGVPAMARDLISSQIGAGLGEVKAWRTDLGAQYSATLFRVDRTLDLAEDLHRTVKPALNNLAETEAKFGLLADTYREVPDRLAYANRWLWDCHEFSGCLQSQTLALVGSTRYTLGKVARASDQFPEISANFSGISGDVHAFTNKYVFPHPMTTGQKFKAAGMLVIGMGSTAARWR